MKTPRLLATLTVLNLVLFVLLLTGMRVGTPEHDIPAVLRGRALEIVDERGRVRASVSVVPAGTSAAGDPEDGREQVVKP